LKGVRRDELLTGGEKGAATAAIAGEVVATGEGLCINTLKLQKKE
jgi:hypothetical protein